MNKKLYRIKKKISYKVKEAKILANRRGKDFKEMMLLAPILLKHKQLIIEFNDDRISQERKKKIVEIVKPDFQAFAKEHPESVDSINRFCEGLDKQVG
jgi:hypothetical protein